MPQLVWCDDNSVTGLCPSMPLSPSSLSCDGDDEDDGHEGKDEDEDEDDDNGNETKNSPTSA